MFNFNCTSGSHTHTISHANTPPPAQIVCFLLFSNNDKKKFNRGIVQMNDDYQILCGKITAKNSHGNGKILQKYSN